MSFQGDVAGLGLSEVLQSLSRSENEGVLLLEAPGLAVRIGMRDSQLFLLPSPTEDQELLLRRVQCAWIEDLPLAVRERRVQEIAKAERLESLYSMLDAPQMHFRFSPGPIVGLLGLATQDPTQPLDPAALFGPGYTAEFVLLEHARLHDEAQGKQHLHAWSVPLRQAAVPADTRRGLLTQCDGTATLIEIADRLGWPLRQARAAVCEAIERREVALLAPAQVFSTALNELAAYRIARAATRLGAWVHLRAGGPFEPSQVTCLLREWEAGRLVSALRLMPLRELRGLLRALDRSVSDPRGALERWEAVRETFRSDSACALRCMAWRCTQGGASGEGAIGELLRLGVQFRDRGLLWRASVALRLAATQQPTQVASRLELGAQLCEAGLPSEGAHWVLSASRELVEAGELDRALHALRSLARHDPDNKDAQGLLLQTSSLARRRRRRRMQGSVALGFFLCATMATVIEVRRRGNLEQELARIAELGTDPKRGITELARCFPNDERVEIVTLRNTLQRRLVEGEQARRQAWLAEYEEIRAECQSGDPIVGFDRTLALPAPPHLEIDVPEWPTSTGLLSLLARRLEERTLNARTSAAPEQVTIPAEERELAQVSEVLARASRAPKSTDVADFQAQLQRVRSAAEAAKNLRVESWRDVQSRKLLQEQDRMLEAARSYANALELDRSLEYYEQLVKLVAPINLPMLEAERDTVQRHRDGLARAKELCDAGRHAEARAALTGTCPDLREHSLPWRVSSDPIGARARFADGSSRVTPFAIHSAFGERVQFDLEAPGCVTRHFDFSEPNDVALSLHRSAERSWETRGRAEALPVSVGEDHILCNRQGEIEKLGKLGVRWSRKLATLGGIARTPVFLPQRPGWLLVLCEDGRAFLVEAATGDVEGPHDLGAPPVEGPLSTRGMVIAKLVDGHLVQWESGLTPAVVPLDPPYLEPPGLSEVDRPNSSFVVLRRSASSDTHIESPWTKWRVDVQAEQFRFADATRDGRHGFAARDGQWNYVAWEAPNATIPLGRLWVSDAGGVRSFLP